MKTIRWVAVAVAAAFAAPAGAAETQAAPAPQAEQQEKTADVASPTEGVVVTVHPAPGPMASAVRAYIDPENGRLVDRPVTEEQRRAEAEGLTSGPGAPIIQMRMPDGSTMAILNGNFEMANTAFRGPDGQLHTVCDDVAHAGQPRHVHLKQQPAPAREER